MAEYRDGLGGLSDLARALNDDELEARVEAARVELRDSTEEIIRHAQELRETVTELRPKATVHQLHEPRTDLAVTEDELRYLIERIQPEDTDERDEADSLLNKAVQALALEMGPGGKFVDPC